MLKNGRIYPGTQLSITAIFRDEDDVLVDPETVSFKLMSPCGPTTTYVFDTDAEIVSTETGIYTATISPDTGGRWDYRWETTGTGSVIAIEDSFIVQRSPFTDRSCRDYC